MMRRAGGALVQVLLALWFGSYAGFALIAPILFRAGLTRQTAGDIAGAMIERLTLTGLLAGGVALMLTLLLHGLGARLRAGLIAAGLLVGLYLWLAVLPPLRAPLPKPVDEYALTDPVRVAYNRLHKRSERIASVMMLCVLGALVVRVPHKE